MVNLRTRCRHTAGLNWTAIGIEHTGYSDGDVIGHNESPRSPCHRERVPSSRHQTHGDWRHISMRVYRQRLRRLGSCD
jgi:hypothetical protein